MPGRFALTPLLLVLLLSACDNPTGVGSELLGEQGGDPVEIQFVPVEMSTSVETDVTGGSGPLQRMLVGVTEDADLGQIRATGHMDFVAPASALSADFSGNAVTSATLYLDRGYVYGDTTSSITVRLDDLGDEWTATEAKADTTFPVGSFAAEHTFGSTTALVGVPLPADWVARWDAALRSSSFSDDFHGFRIEAVSGDAVAGFDQYGSFLQAVAGGDTVYFPASRTHSTLRFQEPFSPPQDAVVLQDGRGMGTVLRFEIEDDRLDVAALSRARLEIPFDSTLSSDAPSGYVRPFASISGLTLDAVSVDSGARYSLDAKASVVGGKIRFESSDLLSVIRLLLSGGSALDHFELRVNPTLVSLDVLRLASPASPSSVPRIVLTAVPFQ